MSWSVRIIGNAENVIKKLEEYSNIWKDETKKEFDDAKPHLIALINQNFDKKNTTNNNKIIEIVADGHGFSTNGEAVNRNLNVSIQGKYGDIV